MFIMTFKINNLRHETEILYKGKSVCAYLYSTPVRDWPEKILFPCEGYTWQEAEFLFASDRKVYLLAASGQELGVFP